LIHGLKVWWEHLDFVDMSASGTYHHMVLYQCLRIP